MRCPAQHPIYASNDPQLTAEDFKQSHELAESAFQTSGDSEQVEISMPVGEWARKLIPECLQIMKCGDRVVGGAFMLPTDKSLMTRFLSKGITERDLFRLVRDLQSISWEAVYLAGVVIEEEHRRNGLGFKMAECLVDVIRQHNPDADVYFWIFSPEGKASAKTVRDLLTKSGLRFHERAA